MQLLHCHFLEASFGARSPSAGQANGHMWKQEYHVPASVHLFMVHNGTHRGVIEYCLFWTADALTGPDLQGANSEENKQ